jgi:hypothetical protein
MGPLHRWLRRFDVVLPVAQLGLYFLLLNMYPVSHGSENVAWDPIEPIGRRIAFGLNAPACVAALAVIDLFGLPHKALDILTSVFLVVLWNRVGRWLDGILVPGPDRARTQTRKWKRALAALALLAVIILDFAGWYGVVTSYREYRLQNLLRNSPEYVFTLGLWPLLMSFFLVRIVVRPSAIAQSDRLLL